MSLTPHLQLLKGRELLSVLRTGSRQALHTGGGTAGPWDSFQTGDRLGQRGAGVPDGRRAWAERGRRSYLVTLLQTLVIQQIILILLSDSGGVLVLPASQKLHGAWNGVKTQPKNVCSMNIYEEVGDVFF